MTETVERHEMGRGRADAPVLSVELRGGAATCVLVLRGALTSTSIVALEVQIDQLSCMDFDEVVLDIADLVMIDAIGANVLTGLYHYAEARGAQVTAIGASPEVASVLAATPLPFGDAERVPGVDRT
jgi:anti-anti-sigma factor